MRSTASLIALCVIALATPRAEAAILIDQSPGTFGVGSTFDWGNTQFQYWAESVSFTTPVQLTGMDIYGGASWGTAGTAMTVRIFNDAGGQPGSIFQQFASTITIFDTSSAGTDSFNRRKFAPFTTPVTLQANTTYWIGMSATTGEAAQRLLPTSVNVGDDKTFRFTTSGNGFVTSGDMEFRLYGDVLEVQGAVPEPTSLAIWGLGALGLAIANRRRKRAA